MPVTTIRPATSKDLSCIRELAQRIWPVAYGRLLSKAQLDYMLSLFYTEESLREQMSAGQEFFLVAEKETVLGFAAVGPVASGVWKLHKLYILPQEQGRGLGKALLDHVATHARSKGAAALILQVNRENPARHFYVHEGFKIIEEKDFDIGSGFFMNDFVMKKNFKEQFL